MHHLPGLDAWHSTCTQLLRYLDHQRFCHISQWLWLELLLTCSCVVNVSHHINFWRMATLPSTIQARRFVKHEVTVFVSWEYNVMTTGRFEILWLQKSRRYDSSKFYLHHGVIGCGGQDNCSATCIASESSRQTTNKRSYKLVWCSLSASWV